MKFCNSDYSSEGFKLFILSAVENNRIELVGRPFKKAMHADAKIAYHRDTGGNNSKYMGWWWIRYATYQC